MIVPESFHFLRPVWLGALLPLAGILWMLARRRLRSRGWEAFCEPALLPHVLIGRAGPARKVPLLLSAIAGTLATLALAGPVWRQLPQPLYSGGGALVIALDLSRSMDANDLQPSRLVRARFKIADVLNLRREGQTGLLVFAGDAFTVTPLTDDVATIRSQLTALSTDIMPAPGSRGDKALALAGDLLRQAGLSQGQVLLVTDEISSARGVKAARFLNDAGFRVSVLGVGTERGAPVPLPDGGFLKTDGGEIVVPRLDEESLRSVAAAGGGIYARLTVDDPDLHALAGVLTGDAHPVESSRSEFRADLWRDEGPWLVLLLLPIAALAFRRGYLFVLPLLLVLPPRPAQAFSWDELWLRRDQQAQRALEAGNAARAAELFRDPARQGAARYRAGDFDGAAETLQQAPGVEALYNRGNALARAGHLDDAIAAYSEVLRQDPAHEDARHNKELLEKEKERQPLPQGQQSQQGKQSQQDQQDQGQTPRQEPDQTPGDGAESAEDARPDSGAENAAQSPDSGGGGQPGEESDPTADRRRRPGESQASDQIPGTVAEEMPAMEAGKAGPAQGDEQQGAVSRAEEAEVPDEEQLAAEQWLRRIPDDPGGLLRRKFRYQYQQRARAPEPEEQTW